MTDTHEQPLQQLDLPSAWIVRFHAFLALDPVSALDPRANVWQYFTEDLLQLQHQSCPFLIDLGWYPETTPAGSFRLLVLRWYADAELMGASWAKPLAVAETRSQPAIVALLRAWAHRYGQCAADAEHA